MRVRLPSKRPIWMSVFAELDDHPIDVHGVDRADTVMQCDGRVRACPRPHDEHAIEGPSRKEPIDVTEPGRDLGEVALARSWYGIPFT